MSKPRCQGAKTPGHFTSFECALDDGHDGFCEPYIAPTADEHRVMLSMLAELDALRAIIESGAGSTKSASDLLAKVLRGDYQWPSGVAWAVREAHRRLTGGPPDGVYVRADDESGKASP